MSIRLVVGSQVIEFPSSGQDANYAPAIIQFAQAVTDQLAAISSQFDISPRVQVLSSNANSGLAVDSCVFPSGSVRSFTFTYAIYRKSSTTNLAEDGIVTGVFNTTTSTWSLEHEFNGAKQSAAGIPYHTFSMSGDQLEISTAAIGGSYDSVNSKLSYSAKTQLVSDT